MEEAKCSLVEHQEVLRSSPERSQQEPSQALPPRELGQLRCEVEDILPGTVNIVRGPLQEQVRFLTWVGCPL